MAIEVATRSREIATVTDTPETKKVLMPIKKGLKEKFYSLIKR